MGANTVCSGQGFALVVRGGFAGSGSGLGWSLACPALLLTLAVRQRDE
jgi:hypothetical protein